jgi:hypothetical protein
VAAAGDVCTVRAGTYRETVTPAQSGTASAPITYRSYGTERVVISGADSISGWTQYSGAIYRAPADLAAGYDTSLFANQVFVGEEQVLEARWPNTGSAANLLNPGLSTVSAWTNGADVPVTGGNWKSISGSDTSLSGFANNYWQGATLVNLHGWFSRTGTVTSNSGSTITWTGPAGLPDANGNKYYIVGKLAALDVPGEWFYNPSEQMLYMIPPSGTVPTNVSAKKRDLAFDLSNRSHIRVEGLGIFSSTVKTNPASSDIVLDRLDVKYVSHNVTQPIPTAKTVATQWDACCTVHDARTHDSGIILYGERNTLSNSTINWSSANGVTLSGRNNTVTNNLIQNVNYNGSHSAGVMIIGGSDGYGDRLLVSGAPQGGGHMVTFNTMRDLGRSGINITSHRNGYRLTNTVMAYNHIYDYNRLTYDSAGIYVAGPGNSNTIDLTNTTASYNWIHDSRDVPNTAGDWGHGGVYIDEYVRNGTVHHNVIWNVLRSYNSVAYSGNTGVFNNTFVSPATSEKFPLPDTYKNNIFRGNTSLPGPGTGSNNLFSTTNPLFVNSAAQDYTLQAGSPAVNAGTPVPGITDGFAGSAPDIGAYESGQTRWIPGCYGMSRAACTGNGPYTVAPPTTGIVDGATYEIGALHSGALISVDGSSTVDGANVHQWTDVSYPAQRWVVTSVGSGYYEIKNVNSNKLLSLSGTNSLLDGANVHQWVDLGTYDHQLWQIVSTGVGTYKIVNKFSGKALQVDGGLLTDGANINQSTYTGATNQQWRFGS